MNIDPEEAKKRPKYRAVCNVTGDVKNKLLNDVIKGEKPAHIIRQALIQYYENKSRNGSY